MRTIALTLIVSVISSAAVADVKRYKSMPQPLWGRWGPSADACKNSDETVFKLTATNVLTSNANCVINSVSETPSEHGPKYSVLLRCPKEGAKGPMPQSVMIIWPRGKGELSSGTSFSDLKDYQLCSDQN